MVGPDAGAAALRGTRLRLFLCADTGLTAILVAVRGSSEQGCQEGSKLVCGKAIRHLLVGRHPPATLQDYTLRRTRKKTNSEKKSRRSSGCPNSRQPRRSGVSPQPSVLTAVRVTDVTRSRF